MTSFGVFFYPSQKEILKTAFRIQESAASQLVVSNHDFGRKMPPKKPGVVGPNGLNYGSTHQKIGGGGKKGLCSPRFLGELYVFLIFPPSGKTHQGLQKG